MIEYFSKNPRLCLEIRAVMTAPTANTKPT